jgi:hypothetical protein
MANKNDHESKATGPDCPGRTRTRGVVTLADLAPRQEVKGGRARVFGEASAPVPPSAPRRVEPTRKSKDR